MVIEMDFEFILALNDAKVAGSLKPIRETAVYRKILAAMEAEGTRSHEQNLRYLDAVCEHTIAEMRTLTPEMRSLVMDTIRQNN